MDDIQKIELKNNVPSQESKKSFLSQIFSFKRKNQPETNFSRKPKNWKKPLIIFLLIFFLVLFGIVLPLTKTMKTAKKALNSAKEAMRSAKDQDIDKTGEKLKVTKQDMIALDKSLDAFVWLKIIPFVNNYYADSKHMVKAGISGIEAGEIVVESISPYADLLGFKGQGSFVMGSAEERIKKAVQTLDKVTPKLKDINQKAVLVKKELDYVSADRYPFTVKNINIKEQLKTVKSLVDESVIALSDARPFLEQIPAYLGEPEPARFMVLFQNDKELRSTGGFLTAYSIFRLEHGVVHVDKSDDIYKLDETISFKEKAPEPIMNYLQLRDPVWHIRDTNISPDFLVSMKNFEKILSNSDQKYDYKGIIAVDTNFLVTVLDILGGVDAYGTKFTTEKLPICNCPQVVYELEKFADQPVSYERDSRKDLIGVLLYNMMEKALSSSPKLYWGRLFQAGFEALAEKHLLVYLKDNEAQKGIEALDYGGRVQSAKMDYLHINDTNLGGAKANMFVSHIVEYKVDVKDNGEAIANLTMDYKNPYPPSDCDLEHGQLCLNAPLRNWFRIYVPKGSELIESKGSEVKVSTYEDLGKTVFDGFLQVRPMGSAKLTLSYKLPFKVDKAKPYPLLIQKQPGTEGHQYNLSISGYKEKFKLTVDKELEIKL